MKVTQRALILVVTLLVLVGVPLKEIHAANSIVIGGYSPGSCVAGTVVTIGGRVSVDSANTYDIQYGLTSGTNTTIGSATVALAPGTHTVTGSITIPSGLSVGDTVSAGARIRVSGGGPVLATTSVTLDCATGRRVGGEDAEPAYYLVQPVTDAEAEPYLSVPAPDGRTACGIFYVGWWGWKIVRPSDFPDCAGYSQYEITVACYTDQGTWTTKNIQSPHPVDDTLYVRIRRHGHCGIFPRNADVSYGATITGYSPPGCTPGASVIMTVELTDVEAGRYEYIMGLRHQSGEQTSDRGRIELSAGDHTLTGTLQLPYSTQVGDVLAAGFGLREYYSQDAVDVDFVDISCSTGLPVVYP